MNVVILVLLQAVAISILYLSVSQSVFKFLEKQPFLNRRSGGIPYSGREPQTKVLDYKIYL